MNEIRALENRVLQLENQIKAMSQRTRKEIIWKKQLEDWIMKTFGKYLEQIRLATELKEFENEGGDDVDTRRNSSIQFCDGNGNRRITITKSDPMGLGMIRHITPNVSISTVPVHMEGPGNRQAQEFTSGGHGHASIRAATERKMQEQQQVYLGGSARSGPIPINNRRGKRCGISGPPRKRAISPGMGMVVTKVRMPDTTPIIVSTQSIASRTRCEPELIMLDDDDEEMKHPLPPLQPEHGSMNIVSTSSGTENRIDSDSFVAEDFLAFGTQVNQGLGTQQSQNATKSLNTEWLNEPELSNGSGSSDLSDFDISSLNLPNIEMGYISKEYISRSSGLLIFNLHKILHDYDPGLLTEVNNRLHKPDYAHAEDALVFMKRLNVTLCDFLMQVYGEKVPSEMKEAMADSLFKTFPDIPKEKWYLKNGTRCSGLIFNRINNTRKNLRTQRREFLKVQKSRRQQSLY